MPSIAIIGTGISGLGAAFLLEPAHDITVYEKAAVAGGHSRSVAVNYNGRAISVDTGFIVFNHRNYPNLCAMFRHLQVPVQKSDMSFGVSANNSALEWSAASLNGLFGQRSNLMNPQFLRFLFDVVRFNRRATRFARDNPRATLKDMLAQMKLSSWFAEYYLLPMGGAIWSCPLETMLEFPARNFVDFFEAHGLLTVTQQPQWYTVTGGSTEYVRRLIASFARKIRLSCPVTRVTRAGGKIQVTDATGETRDYDHAVLACHADEALALLQDASPEERGALGAFAYQKNHAVLHRDESFMPKRRSCWASWIYHSEDSVPRKDICVSYWMNQLQGIDHACPLFVTLNPHRAIAKEYIFDEHLFEHPVYSQASVAAQGAIQSMQGQRNTWFCGAYLRNGFHEDGLASAVSVAKRLGAEAPWQ